MEEVVRKFKSFEEEDKAEIEYWRNASYDEKLKTLEAIRFLTYKLLNYDFNRIEKVVKIRRRNEEE